MLDVIFIRDGDDHRRMGRVVGGNIFCIVAEAYAAYAATGITTGTAPAITAIITWGLNPGAQLHDMNMMI